MKHLILLAGVLLCAAVGAQEGKDDWNLSGKLRTQWEERVGSDQGPLAQANRLQSGTAVLAELGATAQAELRASGRNWNAVATAQQQGWRGQGAYGASWINELVATADAGSWQFSAGKKIVGWDVGYAFRPNDLVQQEVRRTLVSSTNEGRPLLMAEQFDAESSWSFVLVNPTGSTDQTGGSEPAMAARYYQRQGSADWHAFARMADRTGVSVGAALAWVATDAVELHASARYLQRADSKAMTPEQHFLFTQSPWQTSATESTAQVLIGGTWTHASQISLLLEAWWDGTAMRADQWSQWQQRNKNLQQLGSLGAPSSAVAGNLAWQSDAFGVSSSLHRSNVYTRISWDIDAWQPAIDLLYHPTDAGLMLTASLQWKGDRMQVQGGVRINSGPNDAVLTQLPVQRQAYVLASWAF
jgi:hypothetical protein